MADSNEWFKVRPDASAHSEGSGRPKMKVHFMTSPYDVPQAFRLVQVSPEWLRVEFRYIDTLQASETYCLPNLAKVEVEKSTKRLVAIELRPEDHDIAEILSSFRRTIDQLSARSELRDQRDWNYKAARNAFDQGVERLTARLDGMHLTHAH